MFNRCLNWVEILFDFVLGWESHMFLTCVFLSPQRRMGVFCGHVGRNALQGWEGHDSWYNVTGLSLVDYLSAVGVRRDSTPANMAFVLPPPVYYSFQGPMMTRPNWPLQKCPPFHAGEHWLLQKTQIGSWPPPSFPSPCTKSSLLP